MMKVDSSIIFGRRTEPAVIDELSLGACWAHYRVRKNECDTGGV